MFSNIINMEKYLEFLPEDIVNKISLYNSHPIADLFKKEFKDDLDLHFNHYRKGKSFDDIVLFAFMYLPVKPQQKTIEPKTNKYCSSCDYDYSNEYTCCPCCD